MQHARQLLLIVFVACIRAPALHAQASSPAPQASATTGAVELTRERTLVDESNAARKTSDYATARAKAAEAVASLIARPESEQGAAWLALLESAGSSADNAQDARTSNAAWRRVVEVRSRTVPDEHPDLQKARSNLALTMAALGDLAGARALQEQVLEVRTRTLSADHADLQKARYNLALTLRSIGDLAGARALQERVLEVYSRTRSDEHPDLLAARGGLANTLRQLGDLAGARALQEHVLEVYSRTLPDEHPHLQAARQSLAITMRQLGDFARARALEEKVLAIRSRTLTSDHPELLAARQNLAATIRMLGDVSGARVLEESVLDVLSRRLPDDHPELQRARGNLAITLRQLGDIAGARVLEEKVVEVFSRTLPDEHPDLQTARNNLAAVMYDLGEFAAARTLLEQVLEARSATQPEDHTVIQAARANLAVTIRAQGDVEGARALQEQVLEVRTRALPNEHIDVQSARENLAMTIAVQHLAGNTNEANVERDKFAALALDFTRALRRSATVAMLDASSREAEERAVKQASNLGLALSFARGLGVFERDDELERAAFLLSESLRGVALQSAGLARRGRDSAAYAGLHDRVLAASAQLAALSQRSASAHEFQEARGELESAERALVQLAAQLLGSEVDGLEPDFSAFSSKLRAGEAWVAYRRYTKSIVQPGDPPRERAAEHLCAFVLRRGIDSPSSQSERPVAPGDARLERIELGPIAPIESAVTHWRAAMGVDSVATTLRGVAVGTGTGSVDTDGGENLRELIFDPLEPALEGVKSLVVVPDDVLQLVPLDALPRARVSTEQTETRSDSGNAATRLLGQAYSIKIRTTLLELMLPEATRRDAGSLVALGDPDHDHNPSKERPAAAEGTAAAGAGTSGRASAASGETVAPAAREIAVLRRPVDAGVLRGGPVEQGFTPLPETRAEVRGIQSQFQIQFGSDSVALVLERRAASRESLTALASQARFLHIATHGWFAPESLPSLADPEPIEAQMLFGTRTGSEARVSGMSPLLLCGLALAGANMPADALGRVPGLITAEEIAALDLSGCELAVLSACDTNVGIRRAGQGVASLQRALHMAGARSVITSLWKVPDEATKELMLDFYRRLWVEKKPKWQALWEAKMMIRNAKDERGQPKYTTRDWAAWVLTGDPN